MACFIVPTTEAIVTTVAKKVVQTRETGKTEADLIPFSQKLGWLNKMLWGGSALLAFEHLWHGEIQPFYPFLTAASDPESTAEMLHEMATVGVGMAILVTAVWAGMVFLTGKIAKRRKPAVREENAL
ncbi:MAG: hypothetical protein IKI58_00715 [Oscillospiraceae bacterium]|nr:hypothetical protein [Oscillospiraceae bacterium]